MVCQENVLLGIHTRSKCQNNRDMVYSYENTKLSLNATLRTRQFVDVSEQTLAKSQRMADLFKNILHLIL